MDKMSKTTYFSNISEFYFPDRKKLGKGSFGEVRLAIHLQTNKTYAIKIIDKKDMASQVASKALQRQITIHSSLTHPHIIRLWQVLRDDQKIYMVMEYAERGNLFYYQNEKKVFNQQETSVFFSQTLSAVEYLHNLNLVHRDLKPENLLLDRDFNVKICDLGWVVEGVNEIHHTFCGTYEYMAPEMIFDREYDYKIDVWALGVLIYELLHGFAPFQGETVEDVRESMIAGQIHIDPDLSSQVQDLIFGILKVNPEERLKFEQIKCHPWMKQMNQKRLRRLSSSQNIRQSIQKQNISNNRQKPRQPTIQSKASQTKFDNKLNLHNMNIEGSKTLLCLKQRKHLQSRLKGNVSSDQLNYGKLSKDKTKQKQNIYKYLKQLEKKKRETGGHKGQNSNLSEIVKNTRLKTEASDKKKPKNQMLRYGTQIGDIYEHFSSTLGHKKRKVGNKKDIQSSNLIKRTQKTKNIRQSID